MFDEIIRNESCFVVTAIAMSHCDAKENFLTLNTGNRFLPRPINTGRDIINMIMMLWWLKFITVAIFIIWCTCVQARCVGHQNRGVQWRVGCTVVQYSVHSTDSLESEEQGMERDGPTLLSPPRHAGNNRASLSVSWYKWWWWWQWSW